MRLILVDQDEIEQAVEDLRAMPSASRTLLAACIEHQGVARTRCSKAARDLESAGFIRIREREWGAETPFDLLPTLAGEEAMQALEDGVEREPQTGLA